MPMHVLRHVVKCFLDTRYILFVINLKRNFKDV